MKANNNSKCLPFQESESRAPLYTSNGNKAEPKEAKEQVEKPAVAPRRNKSPTENQSPNRTANEKASRPRMYSLHITQFY